MATKGKVCARYKRTPGGKRCAKFKKRTRGGKVLGQTLDRDRGICRLNNADREQWIDNDEGLYSWKRRSRLSMREFIRQNKSELDRMICRVLGVEI